MRVSPVDSIARCAFSFPASIASTVLFCIAAVLCLSAPPAHGQTQTASEEIAKTVAAPSGPAAISAASAAQETAAPESSNKGLSTRIKVHGHWMIEVKNPDGKLVSHTEFENSLFASFPFTNPGAYFSRTLTLGEWGITLSGSPAPCPATIPFTFATHYAYSHTDFAFGGPFCVLSDNPPTAAIEPQNCATAPNTGCSQNLTVAQNSSGNLSLMGSVVAANSGTISEVQTILSTCAPTVSPSACASETSPDNVKDDYLNAFTFATLPKSNTIATPCGGTGQISCAVPVSAGQTINVSVTISFQ